MKKGNKGKYEAQTKTILKFEKEQARENFEKGRMEGVKEKDTWHAVLIWVFFIGGLFLGFYYATLCFLGKFWK